MEILKMLPKELQISIIKFHNWMINAVIRESIKKILAIEKFTPEYKRRIELYDRRYKLLKPIIPCYIQFAKIIFDMLNNEFLCGYDIRKSQALIEVFDEVLSKGIICSSDSRQIKYELNRLIDEEIKTEKRGRSMKRPSRSDRRYRSCDVYDFKSNAFRLERMLH